MTLLGEKSDYQEIRAKIDQIRKLNDATLNFWSEKLYAIIDQFILAFDNNDAKIHEDFWSKIVTRDGYGSGSRQYISGWLATLAQVSAERDVTIREDKIPLGFMNFPININDNGNEFQVKVYAGQFGYIYNKEKNEFSSRADYLIM